MPIPIPTIAAVRAAIAGFWPTMRLILFIAAIAFGAVQTVRLEGFRFWPLSIEGALPKVARLETDLANVRGSGRAGSRAPAHLLGKPLSQSGEGDRPCECHPNPASRCR